MSVSDDPRSLAAGTPSSWSGRGLTLAAAEEA